MFELWTFVYLAQPRELIPDGEVMVSSLLVICLFTPNTELMGRLLRAVTLCLKNVVIAVAWKKKCNFNVTMLPKVWYNSSSTYIVFFNFNELWSHGPGARRSPVACRKGWSGALPFGGDPWHLANLYLVMDIQSTSFIGVCPGYL